MHGHQAGLTLQGAEAAVRAGQLPRKPSRSRALLGPVPPLSCSGMRDGGRHSGTDTGSSLPSGCRVAVM